MTIDFEDIKKSRDIWAIVFVALVLLVAGTVGACVGYDYGVVKIQAEAISLGYAEQTKDGYAWNSKRKIEKGIK